MAAELWWIGVVVAGAVVGLSVLSAVWTKLRAPGFHVEGKHVFITGGSQGLGLALAKKYAAKGAKVTLVARDQSKLDAAKREVEAASTSNNKTASVFAQSCDVTDFAAVQKAVEAANTFHDRVTDHVVCAAGFSTPGYFLEQDVSVFRRMMDVDYFGTLYAIKAALPAMVAAGRGDGQVVLVSSGLGLISWIGYAQYSGAKYALRGLAEALRNELLMYGIRVSIYYPGNIDSPGYVEENKTKPAETRTIEGVSDVNPPDAVAQTLIDGISDGQFSITNELMPFLLRTLANGVAPRNNSVMEAVLLPFILPIQMGFGLFMDIVVSQARKAKAAKAKQQ